MKSNDDFEAAIARMAAVIDTIAPHVAFLDTALMAMVQTLDPAQRIRWAQTLAEYSKTAVDQAGEKMSDQSVAVIGHHLNRFRRSAYHPRLPPGVTE